MRLCISIPPITATTSCCSLPDPTVATVGGTMIGVAYFPAKSAEILLGKAGAHRPHGGPPAPTGCTPGIVYSCGALMRRARANRRFIMTLSV